VVALFTVREIAAALRVSTAAVYRLVNDGVLPHRRVGNSIWIEGEAVSPNRP
jgi:excisionase family DNA binding protein